MTAFGRSGSPQRHPRKRLQRGQPADERGALQAELEALGREVGQGFALGDLARLLAD